MSRVSSALKLAEHWEGKSVFTGQAETTSRAPGTLVSMKAPQAWHARPVDESPSHSPDTEILSTSRPSTILRWVRRWQRRIIRTTTSVPRCTGTTRRGDPCRAPAMDNGYCRMHGGARTEAIHRQGFLRFLPSRLRPVS
jgi:hypothetical protein